MNRGDVVIVNFTPMNPAARTRPALIIQNDDDNRRMANTIVAQVTSNISRSHEKTQLLIDATHPDWSISGLRLPSAVNCSNVATIQQADVRQVIGSLSPATMEEIDECLKIALGIT
jgi:mRNA interferase MazF